MKPFEAPVTLGLLSSLLACLPVSADTTWTAGSTVTLTTTLDVNDVLTIEPGVTVIFASLGAQIRVQSTGTLLVNGTAEEPVLFTKSTGIAYWGGIVFDGVTAQGTIDHAIIEKTWPHAIRIEGSSPMIRNITIRQVGRTTADPQVTYGMRIRDAGANPTIHHCILHDITGSPGTIGVPGNDGIPGVSGADGSVIHPSGFIGLPGFGAFSGEDGGEGSDAVAIEIADGALATIAYNTIFTVHGGKGGIGGPGGDGGSGGNGGDGFAAGPVGVNGKGGNGANGGFGADGGQGGLGGDAIALRVAGLTAQMRVFQNVIYDIESGAVGIQGPGGDGGKGGKGGKGASCGYPLCAAGDGGNGGDGADGGNGAALDEFNWVQTYGVSLEPTGAGTLILTNNTIAHLTHGPPDLGSPGGAKGLKGAGGAGGSASPSGFPGDDGESGDDGIAGIPGSPSPSVGLVYGLVCWGDAGTIKAWNNILMMGDAGGAPVGFTTAGVGTIQSDYCCFYNYETLGPGSGSHNIHINPAFVDPVAGDFHLMKDSSCINAGHNNLVVADILDLDGDGNEAEPSPFDIDGEERIANDTVDMGADERSVTIDPPPFELPCWSDLDGNGMVNGLDLALLLGEWTGGVEYGDCPPFQAADINVDCKVNGLDLGILLGAWGACPR